MAQYLLSEGKSMAEYTPTPEQTKILNHDPRKHARILAGPGTGKSTTTVDLIAKLVSHNDSIRLKLLTFTRAATSELSKKISECGSSNVQRPSTIHSFSISVLLLNPGSGGFPEPLRLADTWESKYIIRKGLGKRARVDLNKIKVLLREMSSNWESLAQHQKSTVSPEERSRFLGAWNEHREIFGYTLLQELPYALRRALRDQEGLKGLNYDLLVVDEYQDLNACDLEVLKRISDKGCKLVAVGDDDQSIYSFRQAAPEGIRRFLDDYPAADDYPLSTTLRCGQKIVEWATHVILGDPERPSNRSIPNPLPNSPVGEVALLSFPSNVAEARGIATLVKNLIEYEQIPPHEILILVRSDHNGNFSTPIKNEIVKLGINCADPNSISRLIEEENNRRFLEYMNLLINPNDSIAWASLLALTTGIGNSFTDYIYSRCVNNRTRFGSELIAAYEDGFPNAPGAPSKLTQRLVQDSLKWMQSQSIPNECPENGWGDWIISLLKNTDFLPDPSAQFKELLRNLDNMAEPGQNMKSYLAQIEPLGKDIALANCDGTRIMTMTSSKGLTVQATIIAGLEEGIVPRPDNELSEERRILYVAMTRARKFLYGTWATQRSGPTARTGQASQNRRNVSTFLDGGPLRSEPGNEFHRCR
jgi:DNA helicase-2/ATP-dependent DNA helicase PcrA